MRVAPIICNLSNLNNTKTKKPSETTPATFRGNVTELTPLSTSLLKTDSAKKICEKIQQYLAHINKSGYIMDVKIRTGGNYWDKSNVLAYFAINKSMGTTRIEVYNTPKNRKKMLLKAIFNKDGQMIIGDLTERGIHFERSEEGQINNTIPSRRKRKIAEKQIDKNSAEYGVYEIFNELMKPNITIIK